MEQSLTKKSVEALKRLRDRGKMDKSYVNASTKLQLTNQGMAEYALSTDDWRREPIVEIAITEKGRQYLASLQQPTN
jgi:hypothetical protein